LLALFTLILHLWVNGGYGYMRDELYFVICGRRLAWGYADLPPLMPLIAWASDAAYHSLRGLRLVPALAAAATVALAAEAARTLSGGLYARWLAGLAVLASSALQASGVMLTTDPLQPPAWLAAALFIVKAEQDDEPRWWWAVGPIVALALLAKYTIAFYAVAVALGLMLTPERRLLANWRPWVAALVALAIVAPNLVWQAANGWPYLAHGRELVAKMNEPLSPGAFLALEILTLGPGAAPVWIAGLAAFAFWRPFSAQRWVAIAWGLLIAAMILIHGRPYYAAPAFPLLMAGGAVALETWLGRVLRAALAALVVIGAIVFAPFVVPVLPVEAFVAYEELIGLKASTGERLTLGALPQYYADMFGWPELAETVGKAYQALPPEERARAVFFGRNYGEAAAVDFFGAPWGVPPAISAHNAYYLWGPLGHDGSVMLIVARSPDLLKTRFRSVEPAGQWMNPLGMPDESGLTLWLCRDRLGPPLPEAWPSLRHYD
jgi:hypothetical protein